MNKRHGYATLAALTAVVVLICCAIYLGVGAAQGRTAVRTPEAAAPAWVGTWAASPATAVADSRRGRTYPAGQSVRNVVHTSIGGTAARITVTNLLGAEQLKIAQVSLALRADHGSAAVPGTLRRVTFGGAGSVVVAPGAQRLSDPVALQVPHDGDLLVTIHTPGPGGPVTSHPQARQTSYLAVGDRTQDVRGDAYTRQTPSWHHLASVDVLTPDARGAVVAIGDSITDGVTSTSDANVRWPDVLADRLGGRYGVLNQGISGNRLLTYGRGPSTLARFERDVLDQSGVSTVIVAIGINDLLRSPYGPTADRITAGLADLSRRAHARGLRVVGTTLLPCGGHYLCTPAVDAARIQVNSAVRKGRIFDAVVDFDRALRDPYSPYRMRPAYDSGDHLHPSDAGYLRMGRAVDLAQL
ncbi:SGNH/GDSL hydrolase family protein [Streptomyces sp. NPDC051907]|uniref:SGNH/GDSL hydrolase family protein n=1 Tax=Streptomyces sp. NPDC051907 TaxID=3155284 RepID=UPI00341C96C9